MKKFRSWTFRVMMVVMGVITAVGVIAATQTSKSYDERTYLLVLSLFALLLCWKFAKYAGVAKKKQQG